MANRRKFIKQIGWGALGMGTLAYLPGCKSVASAGTRTVSPESQGVASQGLIDFFNAVEDSGLEFHSIMINRNGKTILEGWWDPFKREYVHALYSLSKSFTSTAIGMLQEEGKLSVRDKVISFFPDKLPASVSDNLAAMSIHDLLTMHTGHEEDTMRRIASTGEGDWVKAFLQLEVPRKPGTYFLYNTGATYMLSAIAQNLSGEQLADYLQPRLFAPLEIKGYDWEEDPRGINVGGYGLRVRTQDILHFGQLYLQKGQWKGKQLLSGKWIEEATKKQVDSQDNDSDWGQGYGYQFWRCKPGCYRGDGAHGQYCIVVPDKNAVIAITSETRDMGASMQLVWDHILPAMKPGNEKLEEGPAYGQLKQVSAQLSLPIETGSAESLILGKVNGKVYMFNDNQFKAEKISFSFEGGECEAVFTENGKEIRIKSGVNRWVTADNRKEGNTLFPIPGRTPMPTRISSHYHWADENKLVMALKYVENAHHDIFTFTFDSKGLELTFDNSLSYRSEQGDERPGIRASL
ncbi:MAG: serine hydrolase [Phaeodactylibacter sp.]|nr:serine hydrolase [Phaeodactylibacter sp.]